MILSYVNCFIQERLFDFRSCWIVFIHVVRGRPGGLLQFSKGGAVKILVSVSSGIHAMWPNSEKCCPWTIAERCGCLQQCKLLIIVLISITVHGDLVSCDVIQISWWLAVLSDAAVWYVMRLHSVTFTVDCWYCPQQTDSLLWTSPVWMLYQTVLAPPEDALSGASLGLRQEHICCCVIKLFQCQLCDTFTVISCHKLCPEWNYYLMPMLTLWLYWIVQCFKAPPTHPLTPIVAIRVQL